jgi:hypothetical protein
MAAAQPPPDEPHADEDHTRVEVKNVNIGNSWLRGAASAAAILRAHGLFTSDECNWILLDQGGVDMFKPDGVNFTGLGVGADDNDDDNEDVPADRQAPEADAVREYTFLFKKIFFLKIVVLEPCSSRSADHHFDHSTTSASPDF